MAKKVVSEPAILTGWPRIAKFLGQPVAVAQRWAKDGMPVRRTGRFMTALPIELNEWLGREAGRKQAVHIVQPSETDLVRDLRRGLSEARSRKRTRERR